MKSSNQTATIVELDSFKAAASKAGADIATGVDDEFVDPETKAAWWGYQQALSAFKGSSEAEMNGSDRPENISPDAVLAVLQEHVVLARGTSRNGKPKELRASPWFHLVFIYEDGKQIAFSGMTDIHLDSKGVIARYNAL